MKLNGIKIVSAIVLLGLSQSTRAIEPSNSRVERIVPVAANVRISVCLASGNITVHGWDRSEVRARSDAEGLELRSLKGTGTAGPATHLDVLVSSGFEGASRFSDSCQASNDVDLDVPKDAVLQLNARDGNVRVVDVAEAHVQTQSGDIELERISRLIDAGALSGDISLKDSSGPANVHAISGSIQALNLSQASPGDSLEARTVSGDITINRIGQTRVDVGTVTGDVTMTGPLARAGRYGFKSSSGDVTLNLPADSSFQINARISQQGEVVTDFPLRISGTSDTAVSVADSPIRGRSGREIETGFGFRRFTGVYGAGDVSITVSSFSGTLSLRRK